MKILTTIILLFTFSCVYAQNYVDLLKANYGNTFAQEFADITEETTINELKVGLTYPIVLDEKKIIITGINFSNHTTKLFPTQENKTSLYSTMLKLGLNLNHSEKWSGTYVLLPKLAADYKNISGNDFQLGGLILFNYTKKENLKYKLGLYGSPENFGMYFSVILGLYYLSPDNKFEANLSLPVNGDINYQLIEWLNIGVDFNANTGSYNLSDNNTKLLYTQRNSQEYSTYLQFNLLKKSILFQLKLLYAINEYQVYDENDKLDFGFSAFEFGKERNMLNPEVDNGLAFKFGLIYRFHVNQ